MTKKSHRLDTKKDETYKSVINDDIEDWGNWTDDQQRHTFYLDPFTLPLTFLIIIIRERANMIEDPLRGRTSG